MIRASTSNTPRLPWAFLMALVAMCALWLGACDVGGIPSPSVDASPLLCSPNERYCDGLEVISCSADGSRLSSRQCPSSSTCVDGVCEPIRSHCDEQHDGPLAFSVSKDELVFEVSDVLKSSTASLDITNCGASPIVINSVRFGTQPTDHSVLPDVFSLVGASLEGLELAAGESERLTVLYQPRYAYSRQGGSLIVRIAGPTFQQFSIALTPETYCISSTPEIDLGLFDDGAADTVTVQNCGTEPIVLDDVELVAHSEAAGERVDATLVLPERAEAGGPLATLDAGEHLDIGFELDALAPGMLDHQIRYDVADADKFLDSALTTELVGFMVADSCHDASMSAPRVWGEGIDETHSWAIDEVPLDQTVHFEMPTDEDAELEPVFWLYAPDGSRARLGASSHATSGSARGSFRPDLVGRYDVFMTLIDAQGRAACESDELTVHARPTEDLYVELAWTTYDDPIADDTGFGTGADLNLHMTAADDLGEQPVWDDQTTSCYGFGEYGGDDADAYRSQCTGSTAEIRSLSVSGAHKEIMVVEQADARFYHLGVRSWSMYAFPGAEARLTVYAHGEPVEEIDLASLWWGTADDEAYQQPPEHLDELMGIRLSGRQAWHFGAWDAQNNRLLPRPPRRYGGGFP